MPVEMVEKMISLADLHHRDKTGEVIHACALYIAAHESPNTPESYYAVLQALEEVRSKMLDELQQKQMPAPQGWTTMKEGRFK